VSFIFPAKKNNNSEISMTCKALIVGINKYKFPGSDLQGCVNDATNVREVLLKYFGFTVKDIRKFWGLP